MSRLPVVGVMGSGSRPYRERSSALGRWLAECGVHLLTGGGGGVMAAVSQSFYDTPNRRGLVLGILPCDESLEKPKSGYPNQWVEIPVLTNLPSIGESGTDPTSRNHINALTSDVIVALPGDAGTLSEVRLAVRYGRPLIAFVESDQEIPGLPDGVSIASSLAGVRTFVRTHLEGVQPQPGQRVSVK